LFKYPPLLEFANMFNYTAMGLGNHDFDDGIEGLVPFIRGANFAVLASNINSTAAPELVNCSK
jgi:2',3'-cyclic-nucleotide 2'-phosphodiesterase (5'-nucleotidase family)